MAIVQQNRPLVPLAPRSRINTRTLRGQFLVLAILAVVGAALTLAAALFALSRAQGRYTDVVQTTAPGLISAQQLGQAIADIDARAAEYQLTARIDVTAPDYYVNQTNHTDAYSLRRSAWATIVSRRADFNRAFFAARNNAHTTNENSALDVITDRFYDYIGALQRMKDALDQGHKEEALAAYANAAAFLHGSAAEIALQQNGWTAIDPQAPYSGIDANIQKLARSNSDALATASKNAPGAFSLEIVVLGIGLLALIATTLLAAVRYAIVTHRVLHLPLTVAVVGACVVAFMLFTGANQAKTDYQTMTTDYFSVVNTAANVRQVGADANADESRLLLSPASSGLNSENALITDPMRVQFAKQTLTDSFAQKITQITRNLPDLQDDQIQSTFAAFTAQDKALRTQFDQQFLAGAIQTYILKATPAFTTFDQQVAQTAQENETGFDRLGCATVGQAAFGRVICGGTGSLGLLTILALVCIPVLALLTVGGIWLRLKEF